MEPIAITGIGCRLPGDSDGPDAYWQNLFDGRDLIRETPADRWNLSAHYAADPAAAGRTYTRWGGFLSRPDEFDAGFFGIAPREALHMDPQQRWLLETTWEALEDAGYPPAELGGTDVGVYVGISGSDYGDVQKRSRYEVDAYTNSGNALSIAANRISYLLDFRGPSLAVDTACSSSLVALDLACRALWRGDVPLAIVGGVNSLFTPDLTIGFSKASMLAPDGRCKPFDAAANGYVRSEGAACVVLRPLDKALANRDRIYAVIRATFVNQDGRTGSMTVPSLDQQVRLLEQTYRLARLRPALTSYVEAHGTGTPVGDRIEATALGKVLGCKRPRDERLWIGSVKSNLGHLEPASGIAGLAKLALSLHHHTIPPSLHFRTPNPQIPFDDFRLAVPTEPIAWRPRAGEDMLCAGVNSFGFGGTNAHAVLTSAPAVGAPAVSGILAGPRLWTVSARSKDALREAARRDASYLRKPEAQFAELAAAVQRRRSHHPHRLAVVAEDSDDAARRLTAWVDHADARDVFAGHARAVGGDVVFVFSGQGSQWPGMGRDLFEHAPLARATIERFDRLMRPAWGHSLAEMLRRGDETIFETDLGQPVFFALQVAIARLLESWGIRPACVLGHSVGEIAAAHIVGALSDIDAARLIVERSRAQERTRGAWRMAAVGLSESEGRSLLAPYGGRIHIAAINSPTQLTLAGQAAAVEEVAKLLDQRGRFARVLPLPYAFHTPAMDPVHDAFIASVARVCASRASVPYVSTVTGAEQAGQTLGAQYWWRNLREPVQFAAAMRNAIHRGHRTFVEIGPHPSLVRHIGELLDAEATQGHAVGTLKRDQPALHCLIGTVAAVHVQGVVVDWQRLGAVDARHRRFPTYPWQHQRFWAESADARALRLSGPAHSLLGTAQSAATLAWRSDIGPRTHAFLGDHRLDEKAVFPAAGYLELMLAAIGRERADAVLELRDVHFERVLWLEQAQLVETTIDEQRRTISVWAKSAAGDAQWQRHARAHTRIGARSSAALEVRGIPRDARDLDVDALYARFARVGHSYGPLFRTLRWAGTAGAEFWGRIALDPKIAGEAAQWFIHPALLDGALQLTLASMPVDEERDALYLPVHIDRVEWLRRANNEVLCRVSNVHHQDLRSYADIELFTVAGEPAAVLHRCCCLRKEQRYRIASGPASLYREQWVASACERAAALATAESWVVCDACADSALCDTMRARGLSVVRCHGDDVPSDAQHIVFWAAKGDSPEPSAQAALDATWPLVRLAQALSGEPRSVRLVVVTAGATWGHPTAGGETADPLQAAVAGLLRTVATELPHVECRLIDLDPAEPASHVEHVLRELGLNVRESEIAYRGGRRFTQRVVAQPLNELARRSLPARRRGRAEFRLHSAAPGNLDHLQWVELMPRPLAHGEVEIDVRAVGLNFRDVLKALDVYPQQPSETRCFGDECTGIVRRIGPGVTSLLAGDEVVAIAPGCFGNVVRVHSWLVARKPANLTFEQAATIPIAFLTADYSLNHVARVQPGETVLVQAAAGGVGLAAVQVARRCGATVLATASPEKHELLREAGVAHAFHSRNLSFVEGIRAVTRGEGVDVVLNSLSGEFLAKSLDLLKPLGRFVEIGKKDIFANESLDLEPFRAAVSFHAVDLARVVATRPEWAGRRLAELLEQFRAGEYRALPHVTFPCGGIVHGFQLMAQGKHRGKVVVTFDHASHPDSIRVADAPPIRCDGTYVVTGGLTGFGWATAMWLVEQGAKALVLASRTGAGRPEVEALIDAWRQRSVAVRVVRCDVADRASVHALFDGIAAELPAIRGVFHSAMVLHDEPLARADRDAFVRVLAPKVQGSWNLHCATTDLDLDHFVLYSSCATLFGSAAQANYVAANRFVEALAALRRARGLPAQAIGWGPLADFGVVSERPALARYLEEAGLSGLRRDDVFDWLRFLLRRDTGCAFVLQADWAKFGQANPRACSSDRLAALLAQPQRTDLAAELPQRLAAATAPERLPILTAHLRGMAAAVLGAEESTIDEQASLADLGLDSLMAFELKIKIDRALNLELPADRLASGTQLVQLAKLLLQEWERGAALKTPAQIRPLRAERAEGDGDFFRIVPHAAATGFETLSLDAVALTYLPEKLHTIGGLSDQQMTSLFGREPFVSNYFETQFGRIGIVTLPIRSDALFRQVDGRDTILRALDLAGRRGARCVSLTGLIPSFTDYGLAIEALRKDVVGPSLTTGHATTTAAVVRTLENMMQLTGRTLARETLAVLGLGSIGQSCVRLMLTVLPHPCKLVLCDLFTKQEALHEFGRALRAEHRYNGDIRVVDSPGGVPDEVYAADTILAAISVPEVLEVDRIRSGAVVVDDSYPPAFTLARAIRRVEQRGDILFSNGGMLRLPRPVRETLVLPVGAEAALEAFGVDAFRDQVARDAWELTACVLSSVLTGRHPGFQPTLGLATVDQLVSHYRGLDAIGVCAARLQCENYFISDSAVARFAERYGGHSARAAAD